MKKMNWLKWPLEHYPISLLIVGMLFVMGIYGMYVMPKDEFPHATIRQGVVVAVYPGATSEEVEQQVARPLERYLFTYGEVNKQQGRGMVEDQARPEYLQGTVAQWRARHRGER